MAVTSRDLRTNQPQGWNGRRVIRLPKGARPPGTLRAPRWDPARASAAGAALAAGARSAAGGAWLNRLLWALVILLISLLVGTLSGWVGTKLDDLRYGRPRTTHLSGAVGHEQGGGPTTEFVAMNMNRRVVILEFPGGDAKKVRTIEGPYLFGAGEHLTPVTLELRDINHDGLPDLLVGIKNEQLAYINQPDGFRLITAEEQQQVQNSSR